MSYQLNRIRNDAERNAIFKEDGFLCFYCRLDIRTLPAKLRTLDHIVPRDFGGTNDTYNIVTACHSCNSKRGNQPIEKFVDTPTLYRLIASNKRVGKHIVRSIGRCR